MFIVFFVCNQEVSHTNHFYTFQEAFNAARKGPTGASFTISFFSDKDPEKDKIILRGVVS